MAAEDALPYAFAGAIYGEMMKATAGLGFAMVVAAARLQLDKGFAVFLVTLFLLLVLTFTVRQLYKHLYLYEQKKQQVHNEAGG
jgi:ABC-type nitrate/sulfonate/bicarbonate transport system permease component